VTASEPAVKVLDAADAFSEVLRKLLANAPDGFLSLRNTKRANSTPSAETWDTDIRFPAASSNCWVLVVSSFSDITCGLYDDSQPTFSVVPVVQDKDPGYERYCDQLVRLLPADWTVNLNDFDTSPHQQIGSLQSTEDRKLAFYGPDPQKVSVEISRSYGIYLSVRSGMPYNAAGGQTVGELRNTVPSGESVIATIREKARVYNLKSLKAEMLYELNRYREAAEICNSLAPEAWFCKSAKENAARALRHADADALYQTGKYEQALVAFTLAIQKTRNLGLNVDSTFATQYQQRALIEAAVGQMEAALQDFNKAVAIKAALPQTGDTLLEFQEAIVLYMYGAPSAGEQACAQAAKVSAWVSSLVTNLCQKMQKAGAAGGYPKSDTKTGQSPINARYPNFLTFHNSSDLDVVIKLIGPSSQGFTLVKGKDVSLDVAAGEYRILLRYTKADGDYVYAKGGPFTIAETSTAHSETKIALPKHSKSTKEAQKQFEQSQFKRLA
jgi:tetratricopeptide (TPR) repeat protein